MDEDLRRIRILVADDHPVVREGLVAILNNEEDMEVVEIAGNGNEVVEACLKHRPDVVLMDLRMPEMGGVEATTQICCKFPGIKVLILTTYQGDEDIYRALQAGARAYLLKNAPREQLLEAVRSVHSGQRYIPPEIAKRLADRIPAFELTRRELDVLKLIVSGLTNKEIAQALNITEGTVKGFVNIILGKLDVSDRTQAATTALRRGIIILEE